MIQNILHTNVLIQSYKNGGFEHLKIEDYSYCSARPIHVFFNMVKEKYKNQIDPVKLVEATYKRRMEWQKENGIPPKPCLFELIHFLKEHNIKMAVVSGSERYIVEDALKKTNIFNYFDCIVCGDEVSKRKPDPEGFLIAVDKLNFSVMDVLILEDSEAGIEVANNGKMDVICVSDLRYPDENHQKMVYKICANLEEVMELVLRM